MFFIHKFSVVHSITQSLYVLSHLAPFYVKKHKVIPLQARCGPEGG